MRPLIVLIVIVAALASTASISSAASTTPAGASTPVMEHARVARSSGTFLVARVPLDRRVSLRARPGGRSIATAGPRTPFGSPVALGVVDQRGDWLAVLYPTLGNGRVAWVHTSRVRLARTSVSLRLDLSRRTAFLLEGERVLRRMSVGIGRVESPTPTGRFAVTDKLSGGSFGTYYGCCIVALTALQPNLPPGWNGGNRIAIHGTDDPASIGVRSSAGCPHAGAADLRALMRHVPLGAPVFIHA